MAMVPEARGLALGLALPAAAQLAFQSL